MSAIEQTNYLKKNKSSFVELVKYQSNYIKELDKKINAWSFFDQDLLINKAEILSRKLNDQNNKISNNNFGVLLGVKDIFNTMEMPTKMGSDAWKNFNSGFDARVIHTLRTKEYLIAGKTSTAEFAVNHQSKTKYIFNNKLYGGTSSSGCSSFYKNVPNCTCITNSRINNKTSKLQWSFWF